MAKRKGPNKATTADTKRRALRVGAKEFLANAGARVDPFKYVSMTTVAAKTGLSRNGLTYHFDTKEQFHHELADYLLGDSDLFADDFATLSARVDDSSGKSVFDRIASAATADLQSLANNAEWAAMEILAIVYTPGDDRLSATARGGYRATDAETWDRVYGRIIEDCGRRPREPFSNEAIGAVLQALVEGAGIRQLFDPETLGAPYVLSPDDPSCVYAYAVAALLAVLTEPADGSDGRNTKQIVDDLLGLQMSKWGTR